MGIHSLFLLLSFQLTSTQVATKDFIIYHGDSPIGTIKAVKTIEKDSTHYHVTSNVAYHSLLYNMDRASVTTVAFYKNLLYNSHAFIEKNGKMETDCHILYNGRQYVRTSTEKEVSTIDSKINWCTSMLYFEEPVGVTTIFAEAYQEICPLVKSETPHVYELTLPGNKQNDYVYKNGELIEIKVHRTLVSLSFRPKP